MLAPAWVAPFVGLPYLEGGDTRAGIDCWGLVALVQREVFGRALPAFPGPRWRKGAVAAEIGAASAAFGAAYPRVPPGEEAAGDVALLRLRGFPIHVGLVVAPGLMLHAQEGSDSCVEALAGLAWRRRLVGVFRWAA